MKIKRLVATALCAVTLAAGTTVFAACGKKDDAIYVGSKNFTESLVVGEIYALALEDAGFKVERELNIAGTLVHQSITSGEIDVYPEYTGTALMSYLQMDMISDAQELYNTVKTEYAERYDIVWLDQTEINDTNGFAVRKDVAENTALPPYRIWRSTQANSLWHRRANSRNARTDCRVCASITTQTSISRISYPWTMLLNIRRF